MPAAAQPQPMSQSARQIHASSRVFVGLTLGLTGLAMAAAFILSFHAQTAVGSLIGLTGGLEFALPVAVDLFVVSALFSLSILRSRGEGAAAAVTGRLRLGTQAVQRVSLVGWTLASIALNVGHALATYQGTDAVGLVAVAGVAILFPFGVLAGSEAILALTLSPTEVTAVAQAKATLVNARIPVGSTTSTKRSPKDQDIDAVIAAELTKPTASIRGVAAQLGHSVHRVRTVRSRMSPAA